MSGLSNFFKSRDPADAVVRPVGPGEIAVGLRLLLGSNGHPADPAAAVDFEHVAALRAIDLLAMHVAVLNDRMLASALPVHSPGGTSLLMVSSAGASSSVAKCVARCAEACIAALQSRRPLLLQALLEMPESETACELNGIGFEDLATLIYLQRQCDRPIPVPLLPAGLEAITYSTGTHAAFAEAITATYEQSLDCPLLHGRRSIEDVVAGHQGTGDFDPNLWLCLTENGRPIAPLLLSRVSGHATMELVYVGLAPAARGRRIGDYLVKRALYETYAAGLRQLTLAVDSENMPALRLYHRHGLQEVHRRFAMMRTMG